MKHEISVDWERDLKFTAQVGNYSFVLDGNQGAGDEVTGVRPKPLMLVALAGCSGMDVASLLKKMRVNFKRLEIKVEGNLTDTTPATYDSIQMVYIVTGMNISTSKVEKAVRLSYDQYCGVAEMYKRFLPVTYKIELREE